MSIPHNDEHLEAQILGGMSPKTKEKHGIVEESHRRLTNTNIPHIAWVLLNKEDNHLYRFGDFCFDDETPEGRAEAQRIWLLTADAMLKWITENDALRVEIYTNGQKTGAYEKGDAVPL